MARKKIGLIFCFILALSLSGCGNSIPEMTDEQSALVTEYAANLLLQYSTSYEGRLVDTSVPPKEEQKTLADAEQINGGVDQNKSETKNENSQEEQNTSDSEAGQVSKPTLSIAQVLGLTNMDVSYTGYQVCDSYPDISSENPVFSMKASSGNKLVVMNLQITNTGAEATPVNTLDIKAKYRCIFNDEKKQSVLLTMLEDDFSAMNITIDAGATTNAVLVTEVSEDTASNLNKVAIEVRAGEAKTIINNP